ncbi:MAG: sulfotransferase domain-containing protein [Pseudomonadota bacterium]
MRFASKPDFIVAGVQKGGTTTLFRYLSRHPFVDRADVKEVGYFADQFSRGENWYKEQFPPLTARLRMRKGRFGWMRTGEATPYYLFHPLAAQRIQAYCPRVRIVVMLRDPIERAFSHYRHHVKLGEETLSFEDAIEAEAERLDGEETRLIADPGYDARNHRLYSYLARGLYAEQLERWLTRFERDQLLIMSSESFFADPELAFDRTQRFVGLPAVKLAQYQAFNQGKKSAIADSTRERLTAYFRASNERLFEMLGFRMPWQE